MFKYINLVKKKKNTTSAEKMVFDWDKAARIIKEKEAVFAMAGLHGDWDWTGGIILKEGMPVFDKYTYLASIWATPELMVDGVIYECYRMESETPNWNADTKWPESAMKILINRETAEE